MSIQDVCDAIEAELRDGFEEDDFDIAVDEDGGEAAIEADEWTLQLAAAAGELVAFLAIDDEPDDVSGFASAWRSALGSNAVDALQRADRELSGALSAALIASGDPFSAAFAESLRAAA